MAGLDGAFAVYYFILEHDGMYSSDIGIRAGTSIEFIITVRGNNPKSKYVTAPPKTGTLAQIKEWYDKHKECLHLDRSVVGLNA